MPRTEQPASIAARSPRAYMEVLEALLWGFHNSRDGLCFPSYESDCRPARCCRDTVYEAIKALEVANILTWVNRIRRDQGARARPVRAMGNALAHHPHQQRLHVPRPPALR